MRLDIEIEDAMVEALKADAAFQGLTVAQVDLNVLLRKLEKRFETACAHGGR